MSEEWSKEQVYDEQLYPLMEKVIAICREHEIPLVCTFQYGDDGEDAMLCTTVITTFQRTHALMLDLARHHGPKTATVLMETVETMPDGSKRVTIRKV